MKNLLILILFLSCCIPAGAQTFVPPYTTSSNFVIRGSTATYLRPQLQGAKELLMVNYLDTAWHSLYYPMAATRDSSVAVISGVPCGVKAWYGIALDNPYKDFEGVRGFLSPVGWFIIPCK